MHLIRHVTHAVRNFGITGECLSPRRKSPCTAVARLRLWGDSREGGHQVAQKPNTGTDEDERMRIMRMMMTKVIM